MSRTKDDIYNQVELKLPQGMSEVCWIPSDLAVVDKIIHLKRDNIDAQVVKVYPTPATLEEIDINRRHPLKDSTDI